MLISLNWLKEFVNLPKTLSPQDLADQFTLKTAEVEKVIDQGQKFDHMVIGHVIEVHPHPNADKLKIAKVSVGKETLRIVCGGENLTENMYVAVAKIGAEVDWHGEGKIMKIVPTKIRGEDSEGMICAGSEIGLHDTGEGPHDILDLSSSKPTPGTPLAEFLSKNDVIFELDNKSLTHRPDLWSHYGIAREMAALTDSKLSTFTTKVTLPKSGASPKITVADPELCPRYCGLIIENITISDSPSWIKERLTTTDHTPRNNVVDITNYVMEELGQPMHAFDLDKIGDEIIVRTAKKGEKITALNDQTYNLNEKNLIIADKKAPLAIAGVIGGKDSAISQKTTRILLESANFHASSVRKTSSQLGIRTDSVQRFEKSLDPHQAQAAILRAAELILQLCPEAKISGPITDIVNFKSTTPKLKLNLDKTRSKIGINITNNEIEKILKKLYFEISKKDKNNLTVIIPSFRATKDIQTEDDLIEEVARIHSYEGIPAILPHLPSHLPAEHTERVQKTRLRHFLSQNLGLSEIYNYSFYGKDDIQKCQLPEEEHLKLINSLSEEQSHMRLSLVPNILKNIHHNTKFYDSLNIYEIGRTYVKTEDFLPLENKILLCAFVTKSKSADPFYEAKGAMEDILKHFRLSKIRTAKEVKNFTFAHPKKALTYLEPTGKTLGCVYTLHPAIAKAYDLQKHNIAILELNFSDLLKSHTKELKYQPIAKFPSLDIDISVIVEQNTEIGTLETAILKSDKSLINQVTLFDIYQGQNLESGKKSIAFKVTLQAPDRTLTDQEMTTIQQQIFKNLEKIGGQIRK